MKYFFLFALFICCGVASVQAQSELKRKVMLGVALQKLPDGPGATIRMVTAGSPAQKAGVRADDRVIAINDQALPDEYTMLKIVRRIRVDDVVRFTVLRKDQPGPVTIRFEPAAAPLETFTNLNVESIQLTNDFNHRLRAFVTKPKQATGKLPTILFVSWLSCGTVELVNNDSWTKMLRDIAEQSGCIMLRLEKPGVGDSEGSACADCDLLTELNGYQAALRYLKSRSDVDTTNLIIFGASLGGTLGSIVGKGHNIKAYISAVSVYKSWLEHMIELERRRLTLSGKQPSEVTSLMQGYIEFHSTYMSEKKTPEEIILARPHLAPLWYDEPAHQYGRPAAFYHQVQQQNFMQNWSEVRVPVLVVAGEYDWIMTLEDSKMMVDMVNSKHPGNATRLIAKGMDHHWSRYNNAVDAFNENNGEYDKVTVDAMIDWLKKVIAGK